MTNQKKRIIYALFVSTSTRIFKSVIVTRSIKKNMHTFECGFLYGSYLVHDLIRSAYY